MHHLKARLLAVVIIVIFGGLMYYNWQQLTAEGEYSLKLAAFGPAGVPHRFTVGPEGARMLWVLAPGGFEDLIHEASVPAEAPTVPPAHVLPPADAAEIVLRHGNELL